MAASEIALPDAWMQAYNLLFATPGNPSIPAIDFNQVHFYVGIPPPLNWGGEPAITVETWNGQNVYLASLQPSDYCDSNFQAFLEIAHELVHVLQIQKGPHLSWFTRYVMCFIASGFSAGPRNCFEKEAYAYGYDAGGADGLPALLACQLLGLNPNVKPNPCNQEQLGATPMPFPGDPNQFGPMPAPYICDPLNLPRFNPNFAAYIAMHPELTKSSTNCTVGDCLGAGLTRFNIGGLFLDALAIILAPFIALATLAGVNVGMVVGAVLGLIGGAILGDLIGAIVGALIGVMIAFLGAALGGLIGALLQDLFDFVFGGDSGGQLNVKISSDDGLDFGVKHSFERSREQMALALMGDVLFVGWIGNDAWVNVLALSNSFPNVATARFEQSNHCGPAIAWDDSTGNLFVAWVGTEGHLNIRAINLPIPAAGGNATFNLMPKQTLWGAKSPADATPGLVAANGFLYLAWIEDPTGVIHVWRSKDQGATWVEPVPTSGRTLKTGTAALSFDGERLYLAWLSPGPTTNVMLESFSQDPNDGSLAAPRNGIVVYGGVAATAAVKGGPASACGDGRLFIAWTDAKQSMHLVSSLDQGASFTTQKLLNPETSRGNAGPAVAFESGVPTSTLIFGWTGQG